MKTSEFRTAAVLMLGFGLVALVMVALPASAAPRLIYDSGDPLEQLYLPTYQTIQCTLNTTTTADYLGNNHSFEHAANLADYSNLALAHGDVPTDPIQVTPDEDYFQLANAIPGYLYEVQADPDGTGNYNLGIVVYDASRTPIMTDSNTLDGNGADVPLVADDVGPYYFKVYQVSAYCTGGTYTLDLHVSDVPYGTYLPLVLKAVPPVGVDPYEPNDTRGTAYVLPVATFVSAPNANFVPSATDQDWFAFYVKSGQRYCAFTSNLSGVDTYLRVFNDDGDLVAYDDDSGGGFASRAEWQAVYKGYYYIQVSNLVSTSTSWDTYDLSITEIGVDAAATATADALSHAHSPTLTYLPLPHQHTSARHDVTTYLDTRPTNTPVPGGNRNGGSGMVTDHRLTGEELRSLEILSDGRNKTYVHLVKRRGMALTPMTPTLTNRIAKPPRELELVITPKGLEALHQDAS
jgi:hypothetical protein